MTLMRMRNVKVWSVSVYGGSRRCMSVFSGIQMGPPDPILGLNEAFQKDTSKDKVNLGVGAYRDDQGKPKVLRSVRKAEELLLAQNVNKEYLGIAGLPGFIDKALKFAYGANSKVLKEGRVAAIQSLSGTGGCRVAAEFMKRFSLAAEDTIYQPNPTWGNHIPICKDAGLKVKQYPYYNRTNNSLDLNGWLDTINTAPKGSAFLVHSCAHNPTGLDPTIDQWTKLAAAFVDKQHLVLMDCAYQGFASGDAEKDAASIRLFVDKGVNMCLVQSFAKNFGLYGERVGCFSVVCGDKAEAEKVLSQLKILVRPMYSNPPANGARLVDAILSSDELSQLWTKECREMAERIQSMRAKLVESLKKAGSKRDWSHVTSQIGMFCFTGLSPEQSDKMVKEHHVYMTSNGRISMAGLTTHNVDYVAAALHKVTSVSK